VTRRGATALLLAGTALTALTAVVAAGGTVGSAERAVFAAVNGLPDGLRPVLWPAQLLGVLGVPVLVAAVALLLRRWRLAATLFLLAPAKLVVEHDVLKALVHRERPGTTVPGAVLRDVPSAGPSPPGTRSSRSASWCSWRPTCGGVGSWRSPSPWPC
jgi:undecaprenyl-diphosphatase